MPISQDQFAEFVTSGMFEGCIILWNYVQPWIITSFIFCIIKSICRKVSINFTYICSVISGDSKRTAKKKSKKIGCYIDFASAIHDILDKFKR